MSTREGDEHQQPTTQRSEEPGVYEIRVLGHLDAHWSTWFDGLRLNREPDGTTTIRGHLPDQPALHGVLQKVRDLGLELVSVVRLRRD